MGSKLTRVGRMGAALLAAAGTPGITQTVGDDSVPVTNLNIPANLTIFGKVDPNVRKPTAIINDTVVTGTDIDQRVALIVAANKLELGADELQRLRLQVLQQIVDETLQIQEAKAHDITIGTDEIAQAEVGVSKNFQQTPAQFRAYLRKIGSSDRSLRRQIEGELAWSRYLRRRVEPTINVGDEEIVAIQKRIEQSRGAEEFHLREIYLEARPDRSAEQAVGQMRDMMQQLKDGKQTFDNLARTYSDATTKSVGGDLDWVRAAQLPDEIAKVATQMNAGQLVGPIEVPGGFSLILLVDKRKVLTADPRDAKLTLKQVTIKFPPGTTKAEATARASSFATETQAIRGCGDVSKVAAQLKADVVDSDSVTVRDLPGALQEIMLKLQVGQATPPFGSPEEGVRTLVLCGRDEPSSGFVPTKDQIQGRLEQQRVNLRAQQMMRDLRRDAIIEYR